MTPKQQELSEQLTKLQRQTVIGVVSGMSQREAYRNAGGKAKSDGAADAVVSEMLSSPKVDAFYRSLINEAATEAVLTRQEALERLSLMATTRITDILEFEQVEVPTINPITEEEGTKTETIWRMKNSDQVEARAAASIKSVTMTKMGPKIEMYDARDAIAQIAKMQGWEAAQKVENTVRIIDDGSNEW